MELEMELAETESALNEAQVQWFDFPPIMI